MNFLFEMEHRVEWGDMDAFGHVNNIQYIRYFEIARIRFLEAIPEVLSFPGNIKPVLVKLGCNYKKPVVYPDTLTLKMSIQDLGHTSMTLICEMHSSKLGLAAVADCTMVMVNFETMRPAAIPEAIKTYIQDKIAQLPS